MTVAELIDKLRKCRQGSQVIYIEDIDLGATQYEIENVLDVSYPSDHDNVILTADTGVRG